jgi:alkylhydroperoxidase/carboxymuconolactone decarboxylase family protein YurZ
MVTVMRVHLFNTSPDALVVNEDGGWQDGNAHFDGDSLDPITKDLISSGVLLKQGAVDQPKTHGKDA